MATFLVRPSNSEKEAFRIKLTAASLLGLKLKPGDLCILSREPPEGQVDTELGRAIAWEASGGMKDNVVQTSKFLQDLYGFKLGDKMAISRSEESLKDAGIIQMVDKTTEEALDPRRMTFWECFAELNLRPSHDCIAKGQTLAFKLGTESRQFNVVDVGAQGPSMAKVTDETQFKITAPAAGNKNAGSKIIFASGELGGLHGEIKAVQQLIDRLFEPKASKDFMPWQGILIYGAQGVGKSYFIEQLAQSGWKNVIKWTPGTKLATVKQPTLLIISPLDMPTTQATKGELREFTHLFTFIRGTPCLVIGEARHPNDINISLRPHFRAEIEIPIPSAAQRKEILFAIWGNAAIPRYWVIDSLAERTHGYVARDLYDVLRRTLELASEKKTQPITNGDTADTSSANHESSYIVSATDIDLALSQIRPSALQEIFLETPNVRWKDIGGQHDIKRQLQNAVERPLKQAKQMQTLNLPPKKGMLMYGPPGCSKTLLVRALAREAGLNFLAVKGAELISQYVGESERAVREVFRKARAASPSIIFFDEIDSIAATRSRPGSSSNSDLNVLTTLLNEMDGFEPLRNVFVVAATNNPHSIDPALLRPGRFDNVVYIPPPDVDARKEIFLKQFTDSNYRPREGCNMEEDARFWAERTEGFSGAEVVAIRTTACEVALDEDPGGCDWYGCEHVEKAMKGMAKSISGEMLEGFERWNAARMR